METSNPKTGLHPLLTAAAVSITVFSAVGVGALTGLLPNSVGSSKDTAPAALVSAAQAPAPASPVAAAAPEIKGMPPAAGASTPTHRPAKKVVVARASEPKPIGSLTERDFAGTPPPPPVAQAPVEAPKPPVAAGVLGVVESVREVSTPAAESNGVGPIAGGIAGAVLGNQVGHGMGRNIATVLGAAAGAFGGKEIEKQVRATKHWEVSVRLDDGSSRTITSQAQPYWHGGERVRLLDGRLTPA
jgi:outer membrane lipoprotein SlyB